MEINGIIDFFLHTKIKYREMDTFFKAVYNIILKIVVLAKQATVSGGLSKTYLLFSDHNK